jgi:hypothetical protein
MGAMAVAACGPAGSTANPDEHAPKATAILEFVAAPAEAEQEAYICFGFDATSHRQAPLAGLRWAPPERGPVTLHHASLLATAEDYPDGPIPCEAMPADAVGLHIWAPGGDSLELPKGVGLKLPASVRRLIVEAHVFRFAAGRASAARAELYTHDRTPQHLAGWLSVQAPVPALRPRTVERSNGRCTLASSFTVLSSWPHMHFLGKEFHGALVRHDGARVPLIDLPSWDFDAQRTYPLDLRLEPGDALETTCVWENPTNDYVLPGPLTTNEMCNQGFIGWPEDAARCIPDP